MKTVSSVLCLPEFNVHLIKLQLQIFSLGTLLFLLPSVAFPQFTDSAIDLGTDGFSNIKWGDYDNDGDLDILLNSSGTVIYRNDGGLSFTNINVPGTYGMGAIWIDYDNDDDLDFFQGTTLYKNKGGDIFQKTIIPDLNNFDKYGFTSTDVADYDNDGDEDIVFGFKNHIYILNNKGGEFLLVDQGLLGGNEIGGTYMNIKWLDADNDGHYDLLSSKLHKNNSNNIFEQDLNFIPYESAYKLTTADYDSDGDMDVLYYGSSVPLILRENTSGQFSEATPVSLQGLSWIQVIRSGDLDNDGYIDLIVMTGNTAKLCVNNGNGEFTVTSYNFGVGGVWDASLGDYDDDGDLDFLISGSGFTKLFRNDYNNPNNAPSVPSSLTANISGNSVIFSWDRSTDSNTPSAALTYNLCLINTDTNDTIKSPSADIDTWNLFKPETGNTQNNNFCTMPGIRPGNYKWTVQSVDNSFLGSAFASFNTFQILNYSTIAPPSKQILKPDESGTTLTVVESSPAGRIWSYGIYPGGPYNNNLTGQTADSYTPDFLEDGRYFIVCKSKISSDTIISNEVMVEVVPFSETVVSEIPFYRGGTIKAGDYDGDNDLDLLFTGNQGTKIFKNTNNTYTALNLTYSLFNGDAAWCDLNKDNKLDAIVMGSTEEYGSTTAETRIFINQGADVFNEMSHSIQGLAYGSLDVGDYDHDGDQDILICGKTTEPVTKIYRNDGNGLFTDTKTKIIQVTDGVARWGDYDNDSDLDIFISGTDFSGNPFSGLFKNNPDNSFTQVNSLFRIGKYSFAEFGDYDNDGDLDILLAGLHSSTVIPTVYKNLGNDQFSEIPLTEDMRYNCVKWIDYDNDGLLDVLLIGNDWYSLLYAEYSRTHKILRNFGNDTFREITYKRAKVDNDQRVCVADLDNDSDLDILQSSYDYNTDGRQISFYENESYRDKTLPLPPSGLKATRRGKEIVLSWNKPSNSAGLSVTYDIMVGTNPDFIDIVTPMSDTTSGYRMVACPGFINDTSYSLTLTEKGTYYWRVQAINNSYKGSDFSATGVFEIGEFFVEIPNPFIQVRYDTDCDWGDFDNDGDQDLLLCGQYYAGDWKSFTHVYENLGNKSFNAIPAFKIDNSRINCAEWIDVDNDNDLDICVSDFYTGFSIYENDGDGNFNSVFNYPSSFYKFSYGDYNNDGLVDFLMYGMFLQNEGNFSFSYKSRDVNYQSVSNMRDLDNDMDLDFFAIYNVDFRLFRNVNSYFNIIPMNLPEFYADYTDFDTGDLDNDGDIDIIITGITKDELKFSILLRNENNMSFSRMDAFIRGTQYGAVSLGDYDNDDDLDILLSGNSFSVITKIYENKGNFNFEEMDYNIAGEWQGTNSWSDFDEDGDLDLLIIGTAEGYAGQSKLYVNELNIPASPVYPPDSLASENAGYGIILSWQDSLNTGVSYNVRVWTLAGAYDITSPMSDLATGKRKVTRMGNANHNLRYQLDSLAVGTYYWSVQAVNSAFKGSDWAPEQTFTISVINAGFSADTVCAGFTTQFTDDTYTTGETITRWEWDFGDGESDNVQDPVHLYSAAGNYSVKLVVKAGIYTDSITKTVVVKAVPVTGFTLTTVCQGTPTAFTNSTVASGISITSWLWNFGDGGSSNQQNPGVHGYLNPGDYTVTLWAYADNGCSAFFRDTAIVGSYPVASIAASGPLVFCKGDSVILSVSKNKNYSYNWMLEETSIAEGDSNRYTAKISGKYSVGITNNIGNCTSTSIKANVAALNAPTPPLITAGGKVKFCEGDSVVLSVVSTTGNHYQWKRDGGAVGADTSQFTARSSGFYSLTVFNSSGCFVNSTNNVNVTVNPTPVIPTVSISGPTQFCEGESVNLSVSLSEGITYSWHNQDGALTGAVSNSFAATLTGEYFLEIQNSDGCRSKTVPVGVIVGRMPLKPDIETGSYTEGKCLGETPIRLSVDNAITGYNYKWFRNGASVADTSFIEGFLKPGQYYVEVQDGECTNDSDSLNVWFKDAPPKPFIYAKGPTVWYLTSSIITALKYKWYYNGMLISGADDYLYIANQNLGKYNLSISNDGVCYTISDTLTIPEVTGIDDADPFEAMRIYPNPTTGLFTIEMNNNVFGELIIDIFSQNGSKVLNIKFEKTTEHFSSQIDLSGHSKGMYLINLSIDKFKAVRKVMVE